MTLVTTKLVSFKTFGVQIYQIIFASSSSYKTVVLESTLTKCVILRPFVLYYHICDFYVYCLSMHFQKVYKANKLCMIAIELHRFIYIRKAQTT